MTRRMGSCDELPLAAAESDAVFAATAAAPRAHMMKQSYANVAPSKSGCRLCCAARWQRGLNEYMYDMTL